MSRQKYARTRIVAPFAGVVKEKKISAGDLVKNGSPAFSIIQMHTLKFNFSIPEKDVGKLQQDRSLRQGRRLSGCEFRGKINIVAPILDEKTRTLKWRPLSEC
jgi:multidrug efflux pump subunit AcrA (membrane-fusion protein)